MFVESTNRVDSDKQCCSIFGIPIPTITYFLSEHKPSSVYEFASKLWIEPSVDNDQASVYTAASSGLAQPNQLFPTQIMSSFRSRKDTSISFASILESTFPSTDPNITIASGINSKPNFGTLQHWRSSNAHGEHIIQSDTGGPDQFNDINYFLTIIGLQFRRNRSTWRNRSGKSDRLVVEAGDAHLTLLRQECLNALQWLEQTFATSNSSQASKPFKLFRSGSLGVSSSNSALFPLGSGSTVAGHTPTVVNNNMLSSWSISPSGTSSADFKSKFRSSKQTIARESDTTRSHEPTIDELKPLDDAGPLTTVKLDQRYGSYYRSDNLSVFNARFASSSGDHYVQVSRSSGSGEDSSSISGNDSSRGADSDENIDAVTSLFIHNVKKVDITTALSQVLQLQGKATEGIEVLNKLLDELHIAASTVFLVNFSPGNSCGSAPSSSNLAAKSPGAGTRISGWASLFAKCCRGLGTLYKVTGQLKEAELALLQYLCIVQSEEDVLSFSWAKLEETSLLNKYYHSGVDSSSPSDVQSAFSLLSCILYEMANREADAEAAHIRSIAGNY